MTHTKPRAYSAPPNRLETVSAADAAYRALRATIVGGSVASGTWLREVEVAADLGISRTPLREAIARLAGDGLILRTPGGAQVADIGAEISGARHIRIVLEAYAAGLSANLISSTDLAALAETVRINRSLPLQAVRDRRAVNDDFHSRIYRACGIPSLVREIEKYSEYFTTSTDLARLDGRESARAVEDHAEILGALTGRRSSRVESLMRAHLSHSFMNRTAS
ncbi:MAG: GntR family transcriptional regulator [Acetobacteraceae bacterium]